MTYSELVLAIQSYVENTFPRTIGSTGLTSTQQLDIFIRQAEQRIFNSVQILDLRKTTTGTCTSSNAYVNAPADWLANYSFAVLDADGAYTYLLNKDVEFIREAYANPSTTGVPRFYAYFDKDTFILGPTPSSNYSYELHYFYYPQSIVDASTSWLGDNFDSVLLYGALVEAYTFMKGEEDVLKNYQARYNDALSALKGLAEGKDRSDTYRSNQIRYPVR